MGFDRLKRPK